jgi:hypothetical protein
MGERKTRIIMGDTTTTEATTTTLHEGKWKHATAVLPGGVELNLALVDIVQFIMKISIERCLIGAHFVNLPDMGAG